jgi:predicted Na+-dependent transporter
VLVLTQLVFPVVAYLLASLFFPDVDIVTGIVLEYCVPVAVVSFMWTEMYDGNGPLTLAIVLVTTVIAPFSIPALLMVLLGARIEIDVASMMVQMLFMIAIPAVVGMALNDLTRGWGKERLAPALQPATRVLLLVIVTTNASSMAPYMERFSLETLGIMLFMLVYSALGFAAGILVARLMRRDRPTTVSMCYTCGMKNISAGAVIASAFFPSATVFPVMMGTLFQEVLAGLFGKYLDETGRKAE